MGQRTVSDKKIRIEMAPTKQLDACPSALDRFLERFKKATGIEILLVTDESRLSDFGLNNRDLERLAKQLGFPVERTTLIVDIVTQMGGTVQ
jgi:hypothetical protein